MANPMKYLAKMIDAIENFPHHYKAYPSLGEEICKSIPFEYFNCRFGFKPNNVYDYSFKRNKSSIKEPCWSTSRSNEEEEGTKSEES